MFTAGLLAVLSLLHIAWSALGRRDPCQSSASTDSVGESLLNSKQENYDRFEEVLVSIFDIAVLATHSFGYSFLLLTENENCLTKRIRTSEYFLYLF